MSDTSKREELGALIEEHRGVSAAFSDMSPIGNLARRTIRALEAVFEQACTPSDDEREALIGRAQGVTENMKVSAGDRRGDEWCYIRYRDVDALQAVLAALRRTAVQEPSAEEVDESAPRYQPCHFDTSGMYVRTWCHTHGYDHLTPDGDVYVQGFDLGGGKTYTGPVSQEDLFGVEPQGEPSDSGKTEDSSGI